MSHYRTLKVALTDKEAILAALASMGMEAEEHVALINYFGEKAQVADIVIRNKYNRTNVGGDALMVGAGRADFGLTFDAKAGAYVATFDNYGSTQTGTFLQHLTQRAAAFAAAGALREQYGDISPEFAYDRQTQTYDVTMNVGGYGF